MLAVISSVDIPKTKENQNLIGKLNVTPMGIAWGNSPGHIEQPFLTTSAMRLPIQAKRSSAWLRFSCSPIGHDFSSSLRTRDSFPETSGPAPFECAFAGPSSWMKPTRRFVPPLVVVRCCRASSQGWHSHVYGEVPIIGWSVRDAETTGPHRMHCSEKDGQRHIT